jgi:hypothetical protein
MGVGPELCGLPRTLLLGTSVNKGKKRKGRGPFSRNPGLIRSDELQDEYY